MSRFWSEKHKELTPYTPGEQPKDMQYVKLNTNESPFPPSREVCEAVREAAGQLHLYPDPDCKALAARLAEVLGVTPDEVILTNGSDEVLNFAFMAFCDEKNPAVFPDITYGFYKVFAALNHIPFREIPLREDFSVRVEDYLPAEGTVFLANPNAPTGLSLPPCEIERILQANPDRVVVIDEAYVDFGGESVIPLIRKYDNLLVTGTFSKSRSMAGARLGFGVGSPALVADLHTLRYSTNPYNVNRMTMAAGLAMLAEEALTEKRCQTVVENRAYAAERLAALGFSMTDSRANFLFARHRTLGGKFLYTELKKRGVLVRHFDTPRLRDYNRITVGTREQMDTLLAAIQSILEEQA